MSRSKVREAQDWLNANWQYAGLVAACFYVLLLPLSNGPWTAAKVLLYLQLPVYVAHQFEEHLHDRFRRFINVEVAGGLDALTPGAVTAINVIGVWCVDFAAMYLARFAGVGWAMLAFYLAVVNGLIHVMGALVGRKYNPGLVTAVVALLPAGIAGIVVTCRSDAVPVGPHVTCIVLVVVFHVAMVAHVVRRREALRTVQRGN